MNDATSRRERVEACVELDRSLGSFIERPNTRYHRIGRPEPDELLAAVNKVVAQWLDSSPPRMTRVARIATILRMAPYDGSAAPEVRQYFVRHNRQLLDCPTVVPRLDFLQPEDWVAALDAGTLELTPASLDALRSRGATTSLVLRCAGASPAPAVQQWLVERWPELDPTGRELDDMGTILLPMSRATEKFDAAEWYEWLARWAREGKGAIRDPDNELISFWDSIIGARCSALVANLNFERLKVLADDAPSLFAHLAVQASTSVAAKCRAVWLAPAELKSVMAVKTLCRESNGLVSAHLLAEIAFETAKELRSYGHQDDVFDGQHPVVRRTVAEFGLTAEQSLKVLSLVEVCVLVSELQASSSRSLEMAGRLAEVNEILENDHSAWPVLLPVLTSQGVDSDILRVVTLSSPRPGAAEPSLRLLAQQTTSREVRARAVGLAEFAGGNFSRGLERTVDMLARIVVNAPAFPQPLASPSSTWLCSHSLEHVLMQQLQAADGRLAQELPGRLGRDEEATTSEILRQIRESLAACERSAAVFWRGGVPVPLAIALDERQPSKQEEAKHGADIAFIVDVNLPGVMTRRWAELVQLKKPHREVDRTYGEGWDIDVHQLGKLQSNSPTAAYWLVDKHGVVNCVPAKLLSALIYGRSQQQQESARVGWNSVRSAAIPMSEYLVKLVIGAWLGSAEKRALTIAEGDDPANIPRHSLLLKVFPADKRG